ncbi:unnamed protein product [Phyllotreta striolata]|uniref:HMG box domain-containing protein n=1 Tax=Phyllotreta striolata TaxID=444603 RepID=A0A9N9TQ88_PHYSR|nr:unnamed protein product [Phyllotreta striolata]
MNFLSVQNTQNSFMKPHNNNFVLSETPSKTNFIADSRQLTENNNQLNPNGQEKTIKERWLYKMGQIKSENTGNFDNTKLTWDVVKENETTKVTENQTPENQNLISSDVKKEEIQDNEQSNTKEESPSHHARRPPNAFLIFCKKHRPIVREKYPNLENRAVTKILGEWWALLNSTEKLPYNNLAKEYKDAFLSANPDFRWYKLPAPPLRTLSTRPLPAPKPHPSISSPSIAPTTVTSLSEFTPGKLADESQLGGLTSLMNNFVSTPKIEAEHNNNVPKTEAKIKIEDTFVSPVTTIRVSTPPKPIKKRLVDYVDPNVTDCSRNLSMDDDAAEEFGNNSNRETVDKIFEDGFIKYTDDIIIDQNGLKEPRKSERRCKGKRYETFMVASKLLGNKREPTKFVHQRQTRSETDLQFNNNKSETPKLDLGNTIKRLAERTNIKIDFDGDKEAQPDVKRERSMSETSEGEGKNSPPNFDLNARISGLSSLSYDEFTQRKRDSKKRKARAKPEGEHRKKALKLSKDAQPVGSKKRKNKQSITHLGGKNDAGNVNSDLLGLATLAEVAANTEKINEKISE